MQLTNTREPFAAIRTLENVPIVGALNGFPEMGPFPVKLQIESFSVASSATKRVSLAGLTATPSGPLKEPAGP